QVLVAGVADEGEHRLRLGLLAAPAQRGRQQRAGGGATEDTFLLEQLASGEEALLVADGVGLLHPGEVRDRRQEILADALDHPAGRLLHDFAAVDVVLQDRADRVGQDQFRRRRRFGEAARQARHGARAAAAEHDRVELAAQLAQDLRAGAELVRGRVVGIAELVDEVGAGGLARDALGHVLVVVRMALGHVRAGEHDLRAHSLEVEDLFPAHLVRDHQDQLVTLLLRDQRQAYAGVPGGALDQGVARLDGAALLRGLDHAQPGAVLDRAAGVLAFKLEVERAGPGIEALRLYARRVTDQL